jgi:hypothetical protein
MSTATLAAKKRIMFIKGEDYNYLAYHILIVLDELNCASPERPFRDHRKLAFMTDFVSSQSLANILVRCHRLKSLPSKRDAHSLASAYANGATRKHLITRVISSLERREVVSVAQGDKDLELNVWLNRSNVPESFLASDIYAVERANITLLRGVSPHLRTLNFDTFLQRFFGDCGVHTWHT